MTNQANETKTINLTSEVTVTMSCEIRNGEVVQELTATKGGKIVLVAKCNLSEVIATKFGPATRSQVAELIAEVSARVMGSPEGRALTAKRAANEAMQDAYYAANDRVRKAMAI